MAVRLIVIYFFILLCCTQFASAAEEPHVVYRYETHSSDRVTHYLDVVRLKSFEEKLPALRAGESYKNIEVIFRGHTENECLDWLCPQVEQIWVDWVSINWRGKFDQYVFLGKQYSRDAPRFPCEYFGKDYPVSTPQATDVVPPPPEITGSVAECLRSKGLSPSTGSRNAYADDSRAHEWQENFNREWDEAAMGSQAFQARMRHSGHIYVDSLGWVESRVMSREIQDCTSRQMEAGIRRLAGLMGGDASDREIMALRLAAAMADPDPATRMAKLERLRSGIFSLIMAENYMAQKEQAEVDAVGAFVEPAATISNIVSTFAPGLNDSRDAYEAWKGKDSFSDQPLEWWERALSVAGLVVGSGKLYREAAAKLFGRVAKLPVETVGGKPWKIIKSSTLSPDKRALLDRALAGKGKLPSELAGALPDLERRKDVCRAVRENAKEKVEKYIKAMDAGDESAIKRAMAEVKADRQAITEINRRPDAVKLHFNHEITKFYDEVDKRVKKRVKEEINRELMEKAHRSKKPFKAITEEDVQFFCVSNPPNVPKVGRDRDYTIRVLGKDLPGAKARRYYNKELYNVFKENGALPTGVTGPISLGQRLDQTAVHWLDAEAYNKIDLPVVLEPTGRTKTGGFELVSMSDANQVGMTMGFKGQENFAKAAEFRKTGKLHEAEEHMMEGMYQLRKQFDKQVLGRVEAAERAGLISIQPGPEKLWAIQAAEQAGNAAEARRLRLESALPPDLCQAMEVFRKVEMPDGMSPAEAEAILKTIFSKTPADMADDLRDTVIGWETLLIGKGH